MKVNTDALRNGSDQMNRDIRVLNGLLSETDSIRRQLGNDQSLKEACLLLKIWEQSAEGTIDKYRQFQRLTAAAADKYERCEKNVSGRAGQYTVRRYAPIVIRVLPMPKWNAFWTLVKANEI